LSWCRGHHGRTGRQSTLSIAIHDGMLRYRCVSHTEADPQSSLGCCGLHSHADQEGACRGHGRHVLALVIGPMLGATSMARISWSVQLKVAQDRRWTQSCAHQRGLSGAGRKCGEKSLSGSLCRVSSWVSSKDFLPVPSIHPHVPRPRGRTRKEIRRGIPRSSFTPFAKALFGMDNS
jgi:hypothetical protein